MTEDDGNAPDWGPVTAPDLEDIERLARAALAALPGMYRDAAAHGARPNRR
jgi:predicted Zn-dependent protease with MMP-like domain